MNGDVLELGRMIYGEGGSLDYDTQVRIGSTALNRLEADRPEEFGETLYDVLHKENAYYAVQNQNDPYTWASTGQFPNKDEENRFKQSLGIAYGLQRGTIERKEGMFFLKDSEVRRAKKKPKILNLKKLRNVGKDTTYNYFSY